MVDEDRLETITPEEENEVESYEDDVESVDLDYEDGEDITPQSVLQSWFDREKEIKSLFSENIGLCDDEWAAVLEAEKTEVRKILDTLEAEEYKRFV